MAEKASSLQTTARPRGQRRTAFRVGGIAVRRPRRGHQHDPPAAAGERRRSGPPRSQPQRVRHRARGHPGGCRRHRGQLLPGRPQRVLHSTWSTCSRSRAASTSAWSSAAAARSRPDEIEMLEQLRRREDLHARGRPAHGPRADDRGRDRSACAPHASRATNSVRCTFAITAHRARTISVLEGADGEGEAAGIEPDPPRARARQASGAGHRHHRHRRRGQVEPHATSCCRASCATSRTGRSPSSRWIRRAAAPAARCSATASA